MDKIPDQPSWDFALGFVCSLVVFVIIWVVVEWVAKGRRSDD